MSRRRAGISAGHGSVSWAGRRMDVAAPVATAPPPPVPIVRVFHPAIASPSHKCYRVIRRFLVGDCDMDQIEDIGAFKEAGPAMMLLAREKGRAQVLDPNNRVYGDNLQPMERR